MTPESIDPKPVPIGYPAATRPTLWRRVGQFIAGFLATGLPMFAAAFIAGASSFENPLVWWAWPLAAISAAACALVAIFTRRRIPAFSAGAWIGLGTTALLTGLCFSSF